MKYAQATCSIGTLLQERNLTRPQDNTSRTSTFLTAEEVTDAFRSGDWRTEFHSSTQKSSKFTGHFLQNGEDLNTRESKNGG
jgi:hypothetical protein